MAVVYSYIRFSDTKQAKGSTVQRQTDLRDDWLKRHPEHTLDQTLRLKDLGKSAFYGTNLDPDKGDLGKFVALAKQDNSPIAAGSILMVERLDRFSRQQTRKASRVFCELIELGIKILILDPEQIIDDTNIDNLEVVLPLIIGMTLAYEESLKRRKMGRANWKIIRAKAQQGEKVSRQCPDWLFYDEKKDTFAVKPDGKKALLYIFNQTVAGIGQKQITYELNKRFKPIGRAGKWHPSYIGWVLKNRQVLGEYHSNILDDNGERQPDTNSTPIKGYYPRVISDTLYHLANAARQAKQFHRGPSARFVNLFVGLVWSTDGHKCHIKGAKAKRKNGVYIQRRFVSSGHILGIANACPVSFDYWRLENLILPALHNLAPSDILPPDNDTTDLLNSKRHELAAVENRLRELQSAMLNHNGKMPAEIISAVSELSDIRDTLQTAIEHIQQEQTAENSKPIEKTQTLIEALNTLAEKDKHNARLKLRGLLTQTIDRITLNPRKVGHKVEAIIRILLKGRQSPITIRIDTITNDVMYVSPMKARQPPADWWEEVSASKGG